MAMPDYHYPDNGISQHERIVVFVGDARAEQVAVLFQLHCFFWLVWVAGAKGIIYPFRRPALGGLDIAELIP